jgi:hypothetical protein
MFAISKASRFLEQSEPESERLADCNSKKSKGGFMSDDERDRLLASLQDQINSLQNSVREHEVRIHRLEQKADGTWSPLLEPGSGARPV